MLPHCQTITTVGMNSGTFSAVGGLLCHHQLKFCQEDQMTNCVSLVESQKNILVVIYLYLVNIELVI
jgi:hypothetical protein